MPSLGEEPVITVLHNGSRSKSSGELIKDTPKCTPNTLPIRILISLACIRILIGIQEASIDYVNRPSPEPRDHPRAQPRYGILGGDWII